MNEFLNSTQLSYFLSTFPLVRKVINRYRCARPDLDPDDLAQDVMLGLLIWKRNRPQQDYLLTEWLKIAHRAARNRAFKASPARAVTIVPQSLADEAAAAGKKSLSAHLEGNTDMELHQLIDRIWKVIRTQSFIENYALLLKKSELSSYLLQYRAGGFEQMAVLLQLTDDELKWIFGQIPLSDLDISEFLLDTFAIETTPAALRKARQRALRELRRAVGLPLEVKRKEGRVGQPVLSSDSTNKAGTRT
jgi:hypothetical protein